MGVLYIINRVFRLCFLRKKISQVCLFFLATVLTSGLAGCEKKASVEEAQRKGFLKLYGGANEDFGKDVVQTQEGEFLLIGTSNKGNDTDIRLIKTDQYGNQLFEKNFGGKFNDYGEQLVLTWDNKIAITGSYTHTDTLTRMLFLLVDKEGNEIINSATDPTLNLQWEKHLGKGYNYYGKSIFPTSDRGYIMSGATTRENPGNKNPKGVKDILMVKVNSTGEVEWTKAHGGEKNDEAACAKQTANGKYILIGTSESFNEAGQNGSNMIVIETNSHGIQTDKLTFGGAGDDFGNDLVILPNNNYVFLGTYANATNQNDIFVVKTEENIHSTVSENFYGDENNQSGQALVLTSENKIAIAGSTNSLNKDENQDIYIILIDDIGQIVKSNTFGGEGTENSNAVIQTKDGGFLLAGSALYAKNSMMTLIKTYSNLELTEK